MTASKRDIGSDLGRIGAHVITPSEYQEIPELDDFFEMADYHEGGKLVRRGRPKSEHPKVETSINLSEEVLSRFRASGPAGSPASTPL